jgi:hypothetical protein
MGAQLTPTDVLLQDIRRLIEEARSGVARQLLRQRGNN